MAVLGMRWRARPPELSSADEGEQKRGQSRARRLPVGSLLLLAMATGLLIEALLGVRLWAQLTSQPVNGGLLEAVFDVTKPLVSPFDKYEPSRPIRETGILEIATLIAMQVALVATAVVMLIVVLVGALLRIYLKPPQETGVAD
jgi:hypothetical protein